MSQRSAGRKAKLLESRQAKKPTAGAKRRIDREKTSRCWFELKNVHKRSAGHFANIARLLAQYNNLPVIAKIDTNGQTAEFVEIIKKIKALSEPFGARLTELLKAHEHKTHLCRGYMDMMAAFALYEDYAKFDSELYIEASPLFEELNEIYNNALTQLREAAVNLGAKVEDVQPESLEVPDSLKGPEGIQGEPQEQVPEAEVEPSTFPAGLQQADSQQPATTA